MHWRPFCITFVDMYCLRLEVSLSSSGHSSIQRSWPVWIQILDTIRWIHGKSDDDTGHGSSIGVDSTIVLVSGRFPAMIVVVILAQTHRLARVIIIPVGIILNRWCVVTRITMVNLAWQWRWLEYGARRWRRRRRQ